MADSIDALAKMDEAAYRAALACLVTFDRRAALPGLTMPVALLSGRARPSSPATQGVERMAGKVPGAQFLCLPEPRLI